MPFIKDPENSGRFDNVLAPKKRLRMLIHRAKQMRKPAAARYFLSRFCGLVCSKEELAATNGLGLRGGKGSTTVRWTRYSVSLVKLLNLIL